MQANSVFVRSLANNRENKLRGDKNGYKVNSYENIIAIFPETNELGLG